MARPMMVADSECFSSCKGPPKCLTESFRFGGGPDDYGVADRSVAQLSFATLLTWDKTLGRVGKFSKVGGAGLR